MRIIDGIRATGKQRFRTTSDAGGPVEMILYYVPAIQRWKIDIESNTFVLKGLRLCYHPNILHQFKNRIKFGISIINTLDSGEPFLINDFSSGRFQLAIISESEVEQAQEEIFERQV